MPRFRMLGTIAFLLLYFLNWTLPLFEYDQSIYAGMAKIKKERAFWKTLWRTLTY